MEKRRLTCVECPMGCLIEVTIDNGVAVSVVGNSCPRGKMYAENEVVCPKRVVTSTVKTADGRMLPVKTDRPVKKSEIFSVMKKINEYVAVAPKRIGDVLIKNVESDADLVATGNIE